MGNQYFNPEGKGYDYLTAMQIPRIKALDPKSGEIHWGSLNPNTGMVLKGRKHPTWNKMIKEENRLGNVIIKENDRYYSIPKEDLVNLRKAFIRKKLMQNYGYGDM